MNKPTHCGNCGSPLTYFSDQPTEGLCQNPNCVMCNEPVDYTMPLPDIAYAEVIESKEIESMKDRIICNSATCDEPATHGVHWTEGELKVCYKCAQSMVGIGQVMGFGVPASTYRELTLNEMFKTSELDKSAEALVNFFMERGIPTTTEEAIKGTKKWVKLFYRWEDTEEALKEYHHLWTTLATAIVKSEDS